MAIIAVPPGIRSVEWTQPVAQRFLVLGGWTGGQRAVDLGGLREGWRATITVAPRTLDQMQAWRAFFSALKGPVNSFLLDPTDNGQAGLPASEVLVNGAGQLGATLAVDGAPANLTALVQPGHIISVGGRGHIVQSRASTNASGQASLSLDPPIIAAPVDNAAVLLRFPQIELRCTSPALGWAISPGRVSQPFSFEAIEVVA